MVRVLGKLIVIIIVMQFFAQPGQAAGQVPVFVSIVPQKYFVQQIGKELVDVQVMVQPGASPATYEPKPGQMAALSKARAYFTIGVPFEQAWLKKIAAANPKMKIVHTDHGIEKISMTAHHHHNEEEDEHYYREKGEHPQEEDAHHHEKEHYGAERRSQAQPHREHSALDPHIWLSPPLVKLQAHTILTALQEIDPAHRAEYQANYFQFVSRIDELDAQLKQTLAGKHGLQFMVFHPSWGYFARTYGIEQVPIEIEGKSPKPAQLKDLIEHARQKGIQVVFVQPQFSTKSAELVAREIGGQVFFADPLAEDWMANLREVADKFKAVLR